MKFYENVGVWGEYKRRAAEGGTLKGRLVLSVKHTQKMILDNLVHAQIRYGSQKVRFFSSDIELQVK